MSAEMCRQISVDRHLPGVETKTTEQQSQEKATPEESKEHLQQRTRLPSFSSIIAGSPKTPIEIPLSSAQMPVDNVQTTDAVVTSAVPTAPGTTDDQLSIVSGSRRSSIVDSRRSSVEFQPTSVTAGLPASVQSIATVSGPSDLTASISGVLTPSVPLGPNSVSVGKDIMSTVNREIMDSLGHDSPGDNRVPVINSGGLHVSDTSNVDLQPTPAPVRLSESAENISTVGIAPDLTATIGVLTPNVPVAPNNVSVGKDISTVSREIMSNIGDGVSGGNRGACNIELQPTPVTTGTPASVQNISTVNTVSDLSATIGAVLTSTMPTVPDHVCVDKDILSNVSGEIMGTIGSGDSGDNSVPAISSAGLPGTDTSNVELPNVINQGVSSLFEGGGLGSSRRSSVAAIHGHINLVSQDDLSTGNAGNALNLS